MALYRGAVRKRESLKLTFKIKGRSDVKAQAELTQSHKGKRVPHKLQKPENSLTEKTSESDSESEVNATEDGQNKHQIKSSSPIERPSCTQSSPPPRPPPRRSRSAQSPQMSPPQNTTPQLAEELYEIYPTPSPSTNFEEPSLQTTLFNINFPIVVPSAPFENILSPPRTREHWDINPLSSIPLYSHMREQVLSLNAGLPPLPPASKISPEAGIEPSYSTPVYKIDNDSCNVIDEVSIPRRTKRKVTVIDYKKLHEGSD